MKIQKAFTLAEALITVGIIGVVAATVIPWFVNNANEIAWSKSSEVFELKIKEAMNQMKTNDVMTGYATNEAFLDAFAEYMKFANRCSISNLTGCFESSFKASDGTNIDTVANLEQEKILVK